ncbi:MAG: hypothetical protein LC792_08550 [Actinobacteria bacterium]|nr:hypothetical protein [Actinomycetota bacterium]
MTHVALRRTGIGTVALTVVGAYAWWATSLRPFTLPSLLAVLAAGGAASALGAALIRRDAPPVRLRHRELWAGLGVAVALWELASFVQHPRSEHPTLSSLTNTLFANHPVRTLGLLLWFTLGAWLARQATPARPLAARALLMLGFLWLGWHVFVRANY